MTTVESCHLNLVHWYAWTECLFGKIESNEIQRRKKCLIFLRICVLKGDSDLLCSSSTGYAKALNLMLPHTICCGRKVSFIVAVFKFTTALKKEIQKILHNRTAFPRPCLEQKCPSHSSLFHVFFSIKEIQASTVVKSIFTNVKHKKNQGLAYFKTVVNLASLFYLQQTIFNGTGVFASTKTIL